MMGNKFPATIFVKIYEDYHANDEAKLLTLAPHPSPDAQEYCRVDAGDDEPDVNDLLLAAHLLGADNMKKSIIANPEKYGLEYMKGQNNEQIPQSW